MATLVLAGGAPRPAVLSAASVPCLPGTPLVPPLPVALAAGKLVPGINPGGSQVVTQPLVVALAVAADIMAWTDQVPTRTVAVTQVSGAVITTVQSSADDDTPDPI